MEPWRKYEKQIYETLKDKYKDCEILFDQKINGHFSLVKRQVDILIKGEIIGEPFIGVVECKYFSKNVDVKIVDGFIGFIEDVNAHLGVIITNKGYSKAAQNRAGLKRINLKVVNFKSITNEFPSYDDFINDRVKKLNLNESDFFKSIEHNTHWTDLNNSSFENKVIAFKENFANTDKFAVKKLIQESGRTFRDFPGIGKIKIIIPVAEINYKSVKGKSQYNFYISEITENKFQEIVDFSLSELRNDIKIWRDFLSNDKIFNKVNMAKFKAKYVKILPYSALSEIEYFVK